MSLPHTPEALLGKHVRIQRHGHTYEGVVTYAGPFKKPRAPFADDDLALTVRWDGASDDSGFWLPTEATVELLDGAS